MQIAEVKNPSEKKKLLLAGGLGVVAILFLWWTFFGFGSDSKVATPRPIGQPTPANARDRTTRPAPQTADLEKPNLENLRPILWTFQPVSAPEPGRNIFAYYERPVPTPTVANIPTPTPTPEPPLLLASLSPANVYAKTADFTLEVSGDKFTPQMRIVIDNNELPTRYINAQQLAATVSASTIANPGTRQVMVRSTDGKLYSNTQSISVTAPPTPNYSYIGIIGTQKFVLDTAILQDKASKDTLNVQRGDLLGGRFRVTSISEKEVVVIDSTLKVKHTLAMIVQGDRGNPLQRPTPRVESEDDEP